MGRVVEAFDRRLDRNVAIKYLLATGDTGIARFEREVRITARLQHPGIVPVLDAGLGDDGQPYYVMRKIDGEPLAARVAECANPRDRLALIPAVLGAVDAAAYAHAQGIVHRDIKPTNILLGTFGESLLIDWGLARDLGDHGEDPHDADAVADSALTRAGTAYGTPGYMAPEQARGEPADRRADVYSLGATLYYVLAGESPFTGTDATAAIEKVARGDGPDLARIPREVPAELNAIVEKSLAPISAERYGDAAELALDLRRFLAGKLVAAHDYSTGERVARWIRQHIVVTATIATAAAAIAVVSIVSVRRVIAERDDADAARRLAEARAEEALVDRARGVVATDPTSAIAVLRDLPAASPLWPAAREIVRAAVAGGVERGIAPRPQPVRTAAFAPDGRLAIVQIDGTLEVHDLATGTETPIARVLADELVWLDARTLAFVRYQMPAMQPGALANWQTFRGGTIDLATGAQRELDERLAPTSLVVHRGSLVVLSQAGRVTVHDGTARLRETLADGGIEAIDARDGHLALLGRDRAIVIGPDGARRELTVAIAGPIYSTRIASSGRKLGALVERAVLEWSLADGAPHEPRRWTRSTESLADLRLRATTYGIRAGVSVDAQVLVEMQYVEDTLHGWSPEGSVVAYDGAEATLRWAITGRPLLMTRAGTGAVIATREGKLAIADATGVWPVARRPVETLFVVADRDGRQAISVTGANELVHHTLPAPLRAIVAQDAQLLAVRDRRVVIVEGDVPQLRIVDVASGGRIELGPVGAAPTAELFPERVVARGNDRGEQRVVWDLAGRELSRAAVALSAVGPGLAGGTSEFDLRPSGDVVELPLDPLGEPRTIGRVEGSPTWFDADAGGVYAIARHGVNQVAWIGTAIDARGQREIALTIPATMSGIVRTSDGTWWIGANFRSVWRIGPDGAPRELALPRQSLRVLRTVDDELWALGDTALLRVDREGALRGSTALPGGRTSRHVVDRGYAYAGLRGVEVLAPLANARRSHALAAAPVAVAASRDGRSVAALVDLADRRRAVAVWSDPVPLEPTAVPAYLAALTNARLTAGSDAILWDAR